jgi:hypothetical protein
MMRFYWLALGLLATWRITHLLQAEDGPWDIIVRLRRRAGNGLWGKLLDCFYCLSVWVAAPLAFLTGETWPERLLLWPALSGGAILLERLTARKEATEPAVFWEDEDVVLRKEQTTASGDDRRAAGE